MNLETHHNIDPTVFIAENATVIGDVTMGAESSVWYGCVLRGDRAPITIGQRTNIQDGAIVHEDAEFPVRIGNDVSLGHGAIVHGAIIEDNVLVGIRAVVLNGARVGKNSIIGAGAVVTPGMVVPPGSVVMGIPGKVLRPVDEEGLALIKRTANNYVRYAKEYLAAKDLRERGPD